MKLIGANPNPQIIGLDELPGKSSYFIGNDPQKWRTNVPTYAKVRYRKVYPGIDLLYYGNQRQLEYDFVIAPGADPKAITLGFQGADRLEVDAQGGLSLHTAMGPVRQKKPVIYQEVKGTRREIAGSYVLKGANRVGFEVAAYDKARPLVIDPVLVYSTYLGGSSVDRGNGIAVDGAGSAYVTGTTHSANFPMTPGAFDTTCGSDGTCNDGFSRDAFVTKLNPAGSALVYSTYLGGSSLEDGNGIAVDGAGSAYVTGQTASANFPTTPGAFDTTFNGGADAFVTKLNPDGSALVYSTYLGGSSILGGSGIEEGFGIAVDGAGSAYMTGETASVDFPTTPGAFQTAFRGGISDAFVTKLDPTGSMLVYSTYLGGSDNDRGNSIAVDGAGSAYVTGFTGSANFPMTPGAFQTAFRGGGIDAFVTKLNPDGSALAYSTYLGATNGDGGLGIAVDSAGSAYVTGFTHSFNFPTTPLQTAFGGGDAFVTKLNPDGSTLVYSTFLGGSRFDLGFGIAVDGTGSAYVTGETPSADFPTTPGAFQTVFGGGSDAFMTKLNPDGSTLVYSTYLGGSSPPGCEGRGDCNERGSGIAVDRARIAYVTGFTDSVDFPTTPGAFDPTFNGAIDAFVAKIVSSQPQAR